MENQFGFIAQFIFSQHSPIFRGANVIWQLAAVDKQFYKQVRPIRLLWQMEQKWYMKPIQSVQFRFPCKFKYKVQKAVTARLKKKTEKEKSYLRHQKHKKAWKITVLKSNGLISTIKKQTNKHSKHITESSSLFEEVGVSLSRSVVKRCFH